MVHGEPRTAQDLDIIIDPLPASLDRLLAHIDMKRSMSIQTPRATHAGGARCSTSSACAARGRTIILRVRGSH
ncbi:MAG TPA: hypothetical protein VFP84_04105 [Kofleriaceae bacterium]|nr:hypothetical protein [Kofleriaceae bacterium]